MRRGRTLLAREGVHYTVVGPANRLFGHAVFASPEVTFARILPHLADAAGGACRPCVPEALTLRRRLTFRALGHLRVDEALFDSAFLRTLGVNLVLLPLLVDVGEAPVLLAESTVLLAVALGTYACHTTLSFYQASSRQSAAGSSTVSP